METFVQISAKTNPTVSGWYNTSKGELYWFEEHKTWSCREDKVSEEYPDVWYQENKPKLQEVYNYKGFGSYSKLEFKILIDAGRELNDNDKKNIMRCADNLQSNINKESLRIHPELIKEAQDEKEKIIGLFDNRSVFIEETINEYNLGYGNPWFIVTTRIGRIKIGWRKRVINIDWEDSLIKTKSRSLFPNENVTKEDYYIHADGYKKAKEYIDVLLSQ
jgi:hypothetical protein